MIDDWSGLPRDEASLRQLGKDLSRIVPDAADPPEQTRTKIIRLEACLEHLLKAVNLPNIPSTQRTAACNPLCAILEACQASEIPEVIACIWTNDVWQRAFAFYIERSEVAKPRSMRQLLGVLSKVLTAQDNKSARLEVLAGATDQILPFLYGQGTKAGVKPALSAIEHFLFKDLLTVKSLLTHHQAHIFLDTRLRTQRDLWETSLQHFVHILLEWIPQDDTANAAGRVLATLLEKVGQQDAPLILIKSQDIDIGTQPIWIKPLLLSVAAHPDDLQSYRSNVFPTLFSRDLAHFLAFLDGLGLRDILGTRDSTLPARHIAPRNLSPAGKTLDLLFASLQSAKEMGILADIDQTLRDDIRIHSKVVEIPDAAISRLLGDSSSTVRVASFSLLVSSPAMTKPFTVSTLKALARFLPNVLADPDADVRGDILSLIQKLFDRLRTATMTLAKHTTKNGTNKSFTDSPTSEATLLLEHRAFVKQFLEMRLFDLLSTAPYQRHVMGLKSLLHLTKSGIDPSILVEHLSKAAKRAAGWPFKLHVFNAWNLRSLQDLLIDPFDDVRALAASLLGIYLDSLSHYKDPRSTEAQFPRFLKRAENIMLETARADHADGVARTYALLSSQTGIADDRSVPASHADISCRVELLVDKLDKTIDLARTDMKTAVTKQPMHGVFASLRYMIETPGFYSRASLLNTPSSRAVSLRSLHERIFEQLYKLWDLVKGTLCNDAPEGYVPDEIDEEEDLTTKDVLSYSWRALKEASVLLRNIVMHGTLAEAGPNSVLAVSDFEKLGALAFNQLTELRHRGAFSTVAQTFAMFCMRCAGEEHPDIKQLPERWYNETMLAIRQKSTVLTRRSGGIPSLMVGIMCASAGRPLFATAMKDLLAEASATGVSANIAESDLPQVHALNCLKDIFTNTKIGEASEAYMAETLTMAAAKLESDIWSIRNCGLMLFRALIDRLLGNEELSKESSHRSSLSRLSYDKFPGLLQTLSGLLKPRIEPAMHGQIQLASGASPREASSSRAEAVFPVLQILQRAAPPPTHLHQIRSDVLRLAASPNWHLRDMAARTFAQLSVHLLPTEVLKHMDLNGCATHNEVHGKLLIVKYVVRTAIALNIRQDELTQLWCDLVVLQQNFLMPIHCPVSQAAFLDVLHELLGYEPALVSSSQDELGTIIRSKLAELFKGSTAVDRNAKRAFAPQMIGAALLRQSLAATYMLFEIDRVVHASENTSSYAFASELLSTSARDDPEACIAGIDALRFALRRPGVTLSANSGSQIAVELARYGNNREIDSRVRAALLDVLSRELYASFPEIAASFDAAAFFQSTNLLASPRELYADPEDVTLELLEGVVRLLGIFIENTARAHLEGSISHTSYLERVDAAQRLLVRSFIDTNPFTTRKAAVDALANIRSFWMEGNKLGDDVYLRIALTVYDAINDDDDEIRDVAATVAARIQSARRDDIRRIFRPSVPLVASQSLAQLLAKRYSESSVLGREALRRMLGLSNDASRSVCLPSFVRLFSQARKIDTSLFIEEKQNLFIDDAREARIWSRVLIHLDPSTGSDFTKQLHAWTIEGLTTLIETSRAETDGALGWTSKPEVFVLGLRVIYSAHVLMSWRRKVSKKSTIDGTKIRRILFEFVTVAEVSQVHEMWIDQAEKVLVEEIRAGVGKVAAVLKRVR